MGDFPDAWSNIRELSEGGQGHTFIVKRKDGSDNAEYVLKRLKNPSREKLFQQEVAAYRKLDHPNLLKIVDEGTTPKGKRFMVSRFCSSGPLEKSRPMLPLLETLRFFRKVCDGMAQAHNAPIPVYHLDLKPSNIFLDKDEPVVGDFGICIFADSAIEMTREGPRGSMYYCAPELRDRKIEGQPALSAADVYSLGKLLYWLFTEDVFDGHHEDYTREDRLLASKYQDIPEFEFVDELIAACVQRNPADRIQRGLSTAVNLRNRLDVIIRRLERGGRVLNLDKQMPCMFCGIGAYKSYVDYPNATTRAAHASSHELNRRDVYESARNHANHVFRVHSGGQHAIAPIILVCAHCGNTQIFRPDLVPQALHNWRP